MAGGPSTVELAAAVCEAGGLGFLAAGYLSAQAMSEQIARLRATTDAPFGVNVFLVRATAIDHDAVGAYVEGLRERAARYGVEPGTPRFDDDDEQAKLALLREARVPVVSFTFACPSREIVTALQAVGTSVWVTVTNPEDAQLAAATGCNSLVVQGAAAGGHRGSFVEDGGIDALDLPALMHEVRRVTQLPLVATGGIMTRDDVRCALDAGAVAVQAGTAFLLAPEAGTSDVHRAAVASEAPTGWTRAFTGRTARGVINEFMRAHPGAPAAYPQLHHATAPIRAAARAAGAAEDVSLWAGTRHAIARNVPAAQVVRELRG